MDNKKSLYIVLIGIFAIIGIIYGAYSYFEYQKLLIVSKKNSMMVSSKEKEKYSSGTTTGTGGTGSTNTGTISTLSGGLNSTGSEEVDLAQKILQNFSTSGDSVNLLSQKYQNTQNTGSLNNGNNNTNSIRTTISTIFLFNKLTLQDKNYLSILNSYISTLNIQGRTEYDFYTFNDGGKRNENSCTVSFGGKKGVEGINIFNTVSELDFYSIMMTFNKISSGNKTSKMFILGNDVNTICNSEKTIKDLKEKLGSQNNNIYILGIYDKNDKELFIKEEFFKKMSIELGTQYISLKNPTELATLLNEKIYPIDSGNNLLTSNVNTELFLYDAYGNTTSANITVYQKKGTIFNKYSEYNNDGMLQASLMPGIYYFELIDMNTGMRIRTDPVMINDSLKYKETFYFRKTQLNISIKKENGDGLLGEIKIIDVNNGNFLLKSVDNLSNLLYDVTPGKYSIEVKTKDKNYFKEDITVKGEPKIEKTFITKEGIATFSIVDNNGQVKNNSFLKIYNSQKDLIYNKEGGSHSIKIGAGSYEIEAIDSVSNAKVTKQINIKSTNPDEHFDIMFNAYETTLEIGDEPRLIRIYNKSDYVALPEDDNERRRLALKSISGSGKMKINLFEGEYVIDIYTFNNDLIGKEEISISDLGTNEYSLIKE